jgi:hypothetical protein
MMVMYLNKYADLTDGIEMKLDEAEYEAAISDFRYSGVEVFERLRDRING